MRLVAIDTETEPILLGLRAPRLCCVSLCDGNPPTLYRHDRAYEIVMPWLDAAAAGTAQIVGHNFQFDLAVLAAHDVRFLPAIYAALDADAVLDTLLAEKMIALYSGELTYEFDEEGGTHSRASYALEALSEKYFRQYLDKGGDGWRLRYGLLRDTPIADWPERAVKYAKTDAEITRRLCLAQRERAAALAPDLLYNLTEQVRDAFAIELAMVWGMATHGESVASLRRRLEARAAELSADLHACGLMEKGVKKSKPAQERVFAALGDAAPKTDTGRISTSAEAMVLSGDPDLLKRARYAGIEKLLSTYVPVLERPFVSPKKLNTFLETGRISASDNYLTWPKKGGLRECFRPRPGFVYVSADYDAAELRALAQAQLELLGRSLLADVFRRPGADPHTELAALMMSITVDEAYRLKALEAPALKDMRQAAKVPNFGFSGGMGLKTFITQRAKELTKDFLFSGEYVAPPTMQEAKRLKNFWMQQWPEMAEIFRFVDSLTSPGGTRRFQTPISRRYRGGLGYCDGANNLFQPRTADGAKRAAYLISRACHVEPSSPLYGCHLVLALHDEFLIEAPIGREHEAAMELQRLMVEGMQQFIPDVPISAEPKAMRVWSKDAKTIYENGRIVAWEPKA